jgi:hypothetical protein
MQLPRVALSLTSLHCACRTVHRVVSDFGTSCVMTESAPVLRGGSEQAAASGFSASLSKKATAPLAPISKPSSMLVPCCCCCCCRRVALSGTSQTASAIATASLDLDI